MNNIFMHNVDLRATYKSYSIFEILPCSVNGFHIYNIFMDNVDFENDL